MDIPHLNQSTNSAQSWWTYWPYLFTLVPFLTILIFQFFLAKTFSPSPASYPPPSPPRTPSLPPPPPLVAADHHTDGKPHLLLACTGSVATIKLPQILSTLTSAHPTLSIRVILSNSATNFLQSQSPEQPSLVTLSLLPGVDGIYQDADEWLRPWKRGDPILHIELRRWADVMVIAPLSANGLAKIVGGRSEDLVSAVVRAWDATGLIDGERPGIPGLDSGNGDGNGKKRIVVAPAMNTAMWNHPITAQQINVLEGVWGVGNGGWFEVLRPVEKELACGDTGSGAMKDWREIIKVVEERLGLGTEVEEEYVDVKAMGGKKA